MKHTPLLLVKHLGHVHIGVSIITLTLSPVFTTPTARPTFNLTDDAKLFAGELSKQPDIFTSILSNLISACVLCSGVARIWR